MKDVVELQRQVIILANRRKIRIDGDDKLVGRVAPSALKRPVAAGSACKTRTPHTRNAVTTSRTVVTAAGAGATGRSAAVHFLVRETVRVGPDAVITTPSNAAQEQARRDGDESCRSQHRQTAVRSEERKWMPPLELPTPAADDTGHRQEHRPPDNPEGRGTRCTLTSHRPVSLTRISTTRQGRPSTTRPQTIAAPRPRRTGRRRRCHPRRQRDRHLAAANRPARQSIAQRLPARTATTLGLLVATNAEGIPRQTTATGQKYLVAALDDRQMGGLPARHIAASTGVLPDDGGITVSSRNPSSASQAASTQTVAASRSSLARWTYRANPPATSARGALIRNRPRAIDSPSN